MASRVAHDAENVGAGLGPMAAKARGLAPQAPGSVRKALGNITNRGQPGDAATPGPLKARLGVPSTPGAARDADTAQPGPTAAKQEAQGRIEEWAREGVEATAGMTAEEAWAREDRALREETSARTAAAVAWLSRAPPALWASPRKPGLLSVRMDAPQADEEEDYRRRKRPGQANVDDLLVDVDVLLQGGSFGPHIT